jgi:molybdenum cofactor biosynthesis enzyme MoaA
MDTVKKAVLAFEPFDKNDKINITGGEPTLHPFFGDIVDILLKTDAMITFSTNAYNVGKHLINYLLNVHRIQLPLDGSNLEKISKFRCNAKGHLDKIEQFIFSLKDARYEGMIKFGTVLMDDNVSDLNFVFSKIVSFQLRKVEWCLYPFVAKNGSYNNISEAVILLLKEKCAMSNIILNSFKYSDRNGKYLFINPCGNISTITNDVEVFLPNIF